MLKIDETTVELSEAEQEAHKYFHYQLYNGLGIHDAVVEVKRKHGNLDPEFYKWLED